MIEIVCIGKKHESWAEPGIERLSKRLKRPYDISWEFMPHSSLAGDPARQEESERLLKRLADRSFVVLLDEAGRPLDSPSLASTISGQLAYGKTITFVIGGAYGVDERLHHRADLVWSLSPLVFTHQLARLLLVEQLYRSQQINNGGKYHHE